MATKNARKMIFGKSHPDDSADNLGVKNFAEIALSCTVSEINVLLHFTQKFKMEAKNGRKTIFRKSHQYTLWKPLGVKHFIKITLSGTVSEINAFLCFTQKFKMPPNMAGKRFLAKRGI